jgi:hypothetical protein
MDILLRALMRQHSIRDLTRQLSEIYRETLPESQDKIEALRALRAAWLYAEAAIEAHKDALPWPNDTVRRLLGERADE